MHETFRALSDPVDGVKSWDHVPFKANHLKLVDLKPDLSKVNLNDLGYLNPGLRINLRSDISYKPAKVIDVFNSNKSIQDTWQIKFNSEVGEFLNTTLTHGLMQDYLTAIAVLKKLAYDQPPVFSIIDKEKHDIHHLYCKHISLRDLRLTVRKYRRNTCMIENLASFLFIGSTTLQYPRNIRAKCAWYIYAGELPKTKTQCVYRIKSSLIEQIAKHGFNVSNIAESMCLATFVACARSFIRNYSKQDLNKFSPQIRAENASEKKPAKLASDKPAQATPTKRHQAKQKRSAKSKQEKARKKPYKYYKGKISKPSSSKSSGPSRTYQQTKTNATIFQELLTGTDDE